MPHASSHDPASISLETKAVPNAPVKIDTLGRRWVSALHPRDSKGRFIETGGIARVWGRGLARVLRPLPNNRVEVEYGNGNKEIKPAYLLTMVRRPDGSKPTRSKKKVLAEDVERDADPNRPTLNPENGDMEGPQTDRYGRPSDDPGDRERDYKLSTNFEGGRDPEDEDSRDADEDATDESDDRLDDADGYKPSRSGAIANDYAVAANRREDGTAEYLAGQIREQDNPNTGERALWLFDHDGIAHPLDSFDNVDVAPAEDIDGDRFMEYIRDASTAGSLPAEHIQAIVRASLHDRDSDGIPDHVDPVDDSKDGVAEKPADAPYPETTTPSAQEGPTDEPVRGEGTQVLGDVPAESGSGDERPDSVLRGSGDAGRGSDRGSDGRPASGSGGEAAGDSDEPRPGRGTPDSADAGGAVGAAGPGVPDAGAGDRGPEAAGDGSARVGGRRPRGRVAKGATKNFKPKGQASLGTGNAKTRLKNNIAALKTLRQIEAEGRTATPAEQKVLAKWSGWGAIKGIFDGEFPAEEAELRGLLNDQEWRAARHNMLNAHYTDANLVSSVWDAVKALGFTNGEVLEPGSGSGNFIGHAPDGAHMTGVELDPITAGIARNLYPSADIHNENFIRSPFNPGVFDVVVGNVPFGNYRTYDPKTKKTYRNIHDAFILKGIDDLKPGGVMAVVTSQYTMDGTNPDHRQAMFEQADLLGAVRLPAGAHKDAAGTDVVTDVLLFRKRKPGEEPGDGSWVNSSPAQHADGSPVLGVKGTDGERRHLSINDYFTANPDNVLGKIEDGGYNGMQVTGDGNHVADLQDRLGKIAAAATKAERGFNAAAGDPETKPALRTFGSSGEEGRISYAGTREVTNAKGKTETHQVFSQIDRGKKVELKVPKTQQDELARLVEIRDLNANLLAVEANTDDDNDDTLVAARKALATAYDAYAAKYGPITRYTETPRPDKDGEPQPPKRVYPALGGFKKDRDAAEVFGLEYDYDPGTNTAKKADIFEKRQVARGRDLPEHADEPIAAIALIGERGEDLTLANVAKVMGISRFKAREVIRGHAFADPANPKMFIPRSEYLSGHVRNKLADAETAAMENPDLAENVEALREVVPPVATIHDIPLQLGATWIGEDVVTEFARALMGRNSGVQVVVDKFTNRWSVKRAKAGSAGRSAELENVTWGVPVVDPKGEIIRDYAGNSSPDRNFYDLLDKVLKQQHHSIKVFREGTDAFGEKYKYLDPRASEAATDKAAEIAEEFTNWVWSNADVADKLAGRYTELFRSQVPRSYDDAPTRTFPGMVDGITLMPHQNAFVTRGLNEPSVLAEHVVGAGKTFELAALAMELRRTGMVKKPVLAVPGHMLEQWTSEFRQLYPQAKILAADSDTISSTEDRARFAARARSSDWDIIVMTHGAFQSIPVSQMAEEAYLAKEVTKLEDQRAAAAGDQGLTKQQRAKLEKDIANKKAAIQKQLAKRKDDNGITFESIGFDYIMADEAHVYKNLAFSTNMQGIASPQDAGRARDMHMKLELLRDMAAGDPKRKIAAFATGTPISNSLAEMYTMSLMLRPDLLREAGVDTFDAWAATYAKVESKVEQDTSGTGWVEKTRMRGFTDALGDGLRIWRTFADTKTFDHLSHIIKRPKLKGGARQVHQVEKTETQTAALGSFKRRMENLPGGRPKPGDDTHVAIIGDGRRAAIDPRLMSARGLREAGIDLDSYDELEAPSRKVDAAADNIFRIYQENLDNEYTVNHKTDEVAPVRGAAQMVMIDSDAPKKDRWNSYQALKDRLVALGMPADEIRFVQEAAGDSAKKAKLFDDVRQGRVKVIMGATSNLGTGTNVQNRLIALHHLDGSWKPSDIEQREGRILRQGNQHDEAEVHVYVTQGTHDVKTWDMVTYKQQGLDQIQNGDYNLREVEFADDVDPLTDYDTVTGLASDDPLVMDRRELLPVLKRLRKKADRHRKVTANAKSIIETNRLKIAQDDRDLQTLAEVQRSVYPTTGDSFSMEIGTGYGNNLVSDRKQAAEALAEKLDAEFNEDWRFQKGRSYNTDSLGKLGGLYVKGETTVRFDGVAQISLGFTKAPYDRKLLPLKPVIVSRADLEKGAAGILQRLENRVNGIDDRISEYQAIRENHQTDLDAALATATQPFKEQAELEEAEQQAVLLDELLTGVDKSGEITVTDKDGNESIQAMTTMSPEERARREAEYADLKQRNLERQAAEKERRAREHAESQARIQAANEKSHAETVGQPDPSVSKSTTDENKKGKEVDLDDETDEQDELPVTDLEDVDEDAEEPEAAPEDVAALRDDAIAAEFQHEIDAIQADQDAEADVTTLDPAEVAQDLASVDADPASSVAEAVDAAASSGGGSGDRPAPNPAPAGEPDEGDDNADGPADLTDAASPEAQQAALDADVPTVDEPSPVLAPAPASPAADVPENAAPELIAGGDANIRDLADRWAAGETLTGDEYRSLADAADDRTGHMDVTDEQRNRLAATATTLRGLADEADTRDAAATTDDALDGLDVPDPEPAPKTPAKKPASGGSSSGTGSTPSTQDGLDFTDTHQADGQATIGEAIAEAETEQDEPETTLRKGFQLADGDVLRMPSGDADEGYWRVLSTNRNGSTLNVDAERVDQNGNPVADGEHRTLQLTPNHSYRVVAEQASTTEPDPRGEPDPEAVASAREAAVEEALEQGATKREAEIEGQIAAADAAEDSDAYADGERVTPPPPPAEPKTPKQLPDEDYPLSPEQQPIADAVVADRLNTKVEAKAGAGKTSTLVAIAKRFAVAEPDERIAYVAFNKSVQTEAEGRFPDNTEARTGHSIAFVWRGKKWTDAKFDRPDALRNTKDIAAHLGIEGDDAADKAALVMAAISRFSNQADDALSLNHFRTAEGRDLIGDLEDDEKRELLGYARKAWEDINALGGKIAVNNDHIRKMWALSKPDFSKPGSGLRKPVGVLFLDEAQDTPPVLAKVIADQTVQKVIVGDGDQAIYGFTGATDYLDGAEADVSLPLTKSWRFGPEVADGGNRFLQLLGSKQRVVGGGGPSQIVNEMESPDAILTRSNGGMFAEILKEQADERLVGVPSGTKGDLSSLITSARYLRDGGNAPKKIHEDLAPFKVWSEFEEAADEGDDQKLASLKRLFDQYDLRQLYDIVDNLVEDGEDALAGLVVDQDDAAMRLSGKTWPLNEKIKRNGGNGVRDAGFKWDKSNKQWVFYGSKEQQQAALDKVKVLAGGDARKPDVTVSTAHKSKGLEWDRVRIGDDFRGPEAAEDGTLVFPADEELRLAYVAMTRAAKELDPGSLGWVYGYTSENGGDPDAPKDTAERPLVDLDELRNRRNENTGSESERDDDDSTQTPSADTDVDVDETDGPDAAEPTAGAPTPDVDDPNDTDTDTGAAGDSDRGNRAGVRPNPDADSDRADTDGPNETDGGGVKPWHPLDELRNDRNEPNNHDGPGDTSPSAGGVPTNQNEDPTPAVPAGRDGDAGDRERNPDFGKRIGDVRRIPQDGGGFHLYETLGGPYVDSPNVDRLLWRIEKHDGVWGVYDGNEQSLAEHTTGTRKDALKWAEDRIRAADVAAEAGDAPAEDTNPVDSAYSRDLAPANELYDGVTLGNHRNLATADGDLVAVYEGGGTYSVYRRTAADDPTGQRVVGERNGSLWIRDGVAEGRQGFIDNWVNDDSKRGLIPSQEPAETAAPASEPAEPTDVVDDDFGDDEDGLTDDEPTTQAFEYPEPAEGVSRVKRGSYMVYTGDDVNALPLRDLDPETTPAGDGPSPTAAYDGAEPYDPNWEIPEGYEKVRAGDLRAGDVFQGWGGTTPQYLVDAYVDHLGDLVHKAVGTGRWDMTKEFMSIPGGTHPDEPVVRETRADELDAVHAAVTKARKRRGDMRPRGEDLRHVPNAAIDETYASGMRGRDLAKGMRVRGFVDPKGSSGLKPPVLMEGVIDSFETDIDTDFPQPYARGLSLHVVDADGKPLGKMRASEDRGVTAVHQDDAVYDLYPNYQDRIEAHLRGESWNPGTTPITEPTPAVDEAPTDDLDAPEAPDYRPEPLANGSLPLADGDEYEGLGEDGTFTFPQVDYLAKHGDRMLLADVFGTWERGSFTDIVEGKNGQWEGQWVPEGATSPADFLPVDQTAITGIRRLGALEGPGPETDASFLRPGTLVWGRDPKTRDWTRGVLTGADDQGRAQWRDTDGVNHTAAAGVHPVYGSYADGNTPATTTFAPEGGAWGDLPDGGRAVASPGEYMAQARPDGSWTVIGHGPYADRVETGAMDTLEQAEKAVGHALESWALDTGHVPTMPGATPEDREAAADRVRAKMPAADTGRPATDEPAAASEEKPVEDTTVEDAPEGPSETWIANTDLQAGDVATVTGDDGLGNPGDRTGHVVGDPEPVNVHIPGQGAVPGSLVTVADTPTGDGDRGTVLGDQNAVSVHADRDNEAAPDAANPQSAAESTILGGQIPEQLPVDMYGRGVFPGSVVSNRSGDTGIVSESGHRGVFVRWDGSGASDDPVQPGSLRVHDEGVRPDGWTHGGSRVKPGHIVGRRRVQSQESSPIDTLGVVESVDGDTAVLSTPDGPNRVDIGDLQVIGTTTAPESPDLGINKARLGELSPGDMVFLPGGDLDTRPVEVLSRTNTGRETELEVSDPATGETETLYGDSAEVVTKLVNPDGTPADLTGAQSRVFQTPHTPDGIDTAPVEPEPIAPVDEPTTAVMLPQGHLPYLNGLGLYRDGVTTGDVRDAAMRMRAGQGVTAAQARALAAQLRTQADHDGVDAGIARIYRSIAGELDEAAARLDGEPGTVTDPTAGEPVRSTAGDLAPRDHVTIVRDGRLFTGEVVDKVNGPGTATVEIETADGVRHRMTLPAGETVFRLPALTADPDADVAIDEASEIDRQLGARIGVRVGEAVQAVVDAAINGTDDERDQANSGQRLGSSLDRSGLDIEVAGDARDAAGQAAADAVAKTKQMVADTIDTFEPLPGESDADAKARLQALLRGVADAVDVDGFTRAAVEASQGASTAAPEAKDAVHATTRDAMRADLFAFADQLAGIGEVEVANLMSKLAAQLAGNPDQVALQQAIDALAGLDPRASSRPAIAQRVRGAMVKARRGFLAQVQKAIDPARKVRRTFAAALRAAKTEWTGDQHPERDDAITNLVDDTASGQMRARSTAGLLDGAPAAFQDRLAYFRSQLPGSVNEFGRRTATSATYSHLTADDLAGTVTARPETRMRLDRARDGGPGKTTIAHLGALRGMGAAVDDEIHARIRGALPELGADPAGMVTETRRHAAELERLARTPGAPQATKDAAATARRDAIDTQKAYAAALAEHTRAVLAEIRPMGMTETVSPSFVGRSADAEEVAAIREAAAFLPTDWLAAMSPLEVYTGPTGSYTDGKVTVAPLEGGYLRSALHGLAHHAETAVPGLADAQWAYHWFRTSDSRRARRGRNGLASMRDLFPAAGYRRAEVAREGDLPAAFLGTENDGHQHWELLPGGMAAIFGGMFDDTDSDMRAFLLALTIWMELHA